MADGKAGKRGGWDLTSLHSLDAAAEWVRKGSGALLVLVVRGEDVSFAVDPAIAARDVAGMVEVAMPEIAARLDEQRVQAKESASRKRREQVYDDNLRAAGVRA